MFEAGDKVRHKTDPLHPEGVVESVRKVAPAYHIVVVQWNSGTLEHCLVAELEKIT